MIITLITNIENFGFVTRCSQALENQYFIVPSYPPRWAPLFPWQSNGGLDAVVHATMIGR